MRVDPGIAIAPASQIELSVPIVLAKGDPLNSRFRDLLARDSRLDCRRNRADNMVSLLAKGNGR
jgi:hypothetical protein